MGKIGFFFDEALLEYHVKKLVTIDIESHPHWLCVGATGTGKSVASASIIARIMKYTNSKLILCDFKSDDTLNMLSGNPNFFRYLNCYEGLTKAYNALQDRQSGSCSDQPIYIWFDEFSGFIQSLEKKQAEIAKSMLGQILLMGRSKGIRAMCTLQRADSANFPLGARSQFSVCLGMGNLDPDGAEMTYRDFRKLCKPDRSRAKGYVLIDGNDFKAITIPNFKDMSTILEYLKIGLNR